jgi:hypothetical protein
MIIVFKPVPFFSVEPAGGVRVDSVDIVTSFLIRVLIGEQSTSRNSFSTVSSSRLNSVAFGIPASTWLESGRFISSSGLTAMTRRSLGNRNRTDQTLEWFLAEVGESAESRNFLSTCQNWRMKKSAGLVRIDGCEYSILLSLERLHPAGLEPTTSGSGGRGSP